MALFLLILDMKIIDILLSNPLHIASALSVLGMVILGTIIVCKKVFKKMFCDHVWHVKVDRKALRILGYAMYTYTCKKNCGKVIVTSKYDKKKHTDH